ncbi:MAG: IS5 family transposase [Ralstonia sp.]|uniref:IS5 family transposase n=1 Tax=Ralstonia sp. TaxID=54061 RepID=UPI003F80D912
MWTTENRCRYDRGHLRYESDLTDEEWSEIEPQIPPAKRGGNRRTVNIREVVNGLMYILSTGCQWRALPKDLPPKSTVHDYFDRWRYDRTLERIHHALYVKCREQNRRQPSPTAAVIDSQSVKSAEKGGTRFDPHGFDAGKKIKGKKRHILVDTQGLMLQAIVHAADIQDRDGGAMLLATLFGLYPFLLKLYADGGYQGPEFRKALAAIFAQIEVEIVKRSDTAKGFVVLPRRWVVERTLAWLGRCRRLAKDWECLNEKARAFLLMASIRLMVRRLCRS